MNELKSGQKFCRRRRLYFENGLMVLTALFFAKRGFAATADAGMSYPKDDDQSKIPQVVVTSCL